jgi:hypothetical protein
MSGTGTIVQQDEFMFIGLICISFIIEMNKRKKSEENERTRSTSSDAVHVLKLVIYTMKYSW